MELSLSLKTVKWLTLLNQVLNLFLQPTSPEVVRKFRATFRPDAGQMRMFYGRAYDPHNQWAAEMTHGVSTKSSATSGELVNPELKSLYQQRMKDRKENIYASHIRAPLGTSHNQTSALPKGLNPSQFAFGIPTELGTILTIILVPIFFFKFVFN